MHYNKITFKEFRRILNKRKALIQEMQGKNGNNLFVKVSLNKFDKEHFGVPTKNFNKFINFVFNFSYFEYLLNKTFGKAKIIQGFETENCAIIINEKTYNFKHIGDFEFDYVYNPNYDRIWDKLISDYPLIEELIWEIPTYLNIIEKSKFESYKNNIKETNKKIQQLESKEQNENIKEEVKSLKFQNEAREQLKKDEEYKLSYFDISYVSEFINKS